MPLQIRDVAGMDWFLVTWEGLTQLHAAARRSSQATITVFCQEGKWFVGWIFLLGHCQAMVMQGYIFYFTMVEWSLKAGNCLPPRAKAKAPATGYLPCSCNACERQMVPVDRAGVMLHITIFLHAPLPYLSSSTKRCTFPSASRWQQSQHTRSSATSAMQKVTYSKGTR